MKKTQHIRFFSRRETKTGISIELIFNNLISYIDSYTEFDTDKKNVPSYSSFLGLLRNILFTLTNRSEINHITGDIHYVALALNRKRTILTIHDCVLLEHKKTSHFFLFYKYIWYNLPIWWCKNITTISEKTKQDLINKTWAKESQIKVIQNFYDPIYKRQLKKVNKEQPVLLQIGNKPNKNLNRVIEAIKDIDCKLILVGKLTNTQAQKIEEYSIVNEVYCGIEKESLVKLYKESDIVVFVSTYEGFGMPIIEANAIGRILVASNIEPMNTIASNSAIFVNPFKISSIKEGIMSAIKNDDLRNRCIENGLKNAEKYHISNVAQNYLALYKSINNFSA